MRDDDDRHGMEIRVEFFPQGRRTAVSLPLRSSGLDLMKALNLPPDVHILVMRNFPIPIDTELNDGDEIRVIAVVSGG